MQAECRALLRDIAGILLHQLVFEWHFDDSHHQCTFRRSKHMCKNNKVTDSFSGPVATLVEPPKDCGLNAGIVVSL
jgi:hypothetical protein